jgi:predicted tellurium resistance membrane protein TerC
MDPLIIISIGVAVISVLYASGWLTPTVHITFCLCTTALGFIMGASMALRSKQHKPQAIRSPSVTKSVAMKMIVSMGWDMILLIGLFPLFFYF